MLAIVDRIMRRITRRLGPARALRFSAGSQVCETIVRMGYEYRVRFELNPLDPRAYAPDEFLAQLAASVPSVACTSSAGQSYEYRVGGATDGWPAVVIDAVSDGFFVLENDRRVGTELLGPLVKYALDFAKDERVTIESV